MIEPALHLQFSDQFVLKFNLFNLSSEANSLAPQCNQQYSSIKYATAEKEQQPKKKEKEKDPESAHPNAN